MLLSKTPRQPLLQKGDNKLSILHNRYIPNNSSINNPLLRNIPAQPSLRTDRSAATKALFLCSHGIQFAFAVDFHSEEGTPCSIGVDSEISTAQTGNF